MKSNLFKLAITTAAAAAFLVGCGGGGSDATPGPAGPAVTATGATTSNVNAASVGALSGQAFSFPAGSALGTVASVLTIIDAAVDTFSVSAGANSYSGNLRFGSCIFDIVSSTFPADSLFGAGKTVTVLACGVSIPTGGAPANGIPTNLPVTFTLDGISSSPLTLPVVISPSGGVSIGGKPLGNVPVLTPTGS